MRFFGGWPTDFWKSTTLGEFALAVWVPLGRKGRRIPLPGVHSKTRVVTLLRPTRSSIAQLIGCATCPMKARCCPNTLIRKIARSLHDLHGKSVATSPRPRLTGSRAKTERKSRCCSRSLKRTLKLDRLRLRRFTGADDEFLLAAVAEFATNERTPAIDSKHECNGVDHESAKHRARIRLERLSMQKNRCNAPDVRFHESGR
jgi:hypothetical protein